IVATAMLSGCARSTVDEYGLPSNVGTPLSASTQRLDQCQALQAVIEDRERYGIIGPSQGMDEAALMSCGLQHSAGGGPPSTSVYPAAYEPASSIQRSSDRARPRLLRTRV